MPLSTFSCSFESSFGLLACFKWWTLCCVLVSFVELSREREDDFVSFLGGIYFSSLGFGGNSLKLLSPLFSHKPHMFPALSKSSSSSLSQNENENQQDSVGGFYLLASNKLALHALSQSDR